MPHIRKEKQAGPPGVALSVFFLIVYSVLIGCSGSYAHYGNISASDDVSEMFKAYKVLPDHRYYFSGPEAQPDYIIGLREGYTLRSEFWKPVDLTPRQIDNWLNFTGQSARYRTHPYGADIVGPAGEQIGVWYSVLDWRSQGTVRLEPGNTVFVTIPHRSGQQKFGWSDGK